MGTISLAAACQLDHPGGAEGVEHEIRVKVQTRGQRPSLGWVAVGVDRRNEGGQKQS